MPRYLVTLRHAETGETQTVRVSDEDVEAAASMAAYHAGILDDDLDAWRCDHACPADDVPVPGRDR